MVLMQTETDHKKRIKKKDETLTKCMVEQEKRQTHFYCIKGSKLEWNVFLKKRKY